MISGRSCLVDPRSWDQLLLDSEASLRLVDTALAGIFFRWDAVDGSGMEGFLTKRAPANAVRCPSEQRSQGSTLGYPRMRADTLVAEPTGDTL